MQFFPQAGYYGKDKVRRESTLRGKWEEIIPKCGFFDFPNEPKLDSFLRLVKNTGSAKVKEY
jgi:hypothetical protein